MNKGGACNEISKWWIESIHHGKQRKEKKSQRRPKLAWRETIIIGVTVPKRMRTAKDNFVERYDNGTYSEVDTASLNKQR